MQSVTVTCHGDDSQFWFRACVGGREVGSSVPVKSIEEFYAIEDRLESLLQAVYDRGHKDGGSEARVAMRTAIGF